MTRENFDRASEILGEILELKDRKDKVISERYTYAAEYPELTKKYIDSITKTIDSEISKLEKEFVAL
jgi:DNA-directed RNA polymerase specialized sigma subunit